MLSGYRHFIAAIELILASPSYSQEAKRDQAKANQNPAAQLERIATAIEKQSVATAPDRGCQPGQENRHSDLCAQWKAADAATESARWTFWTFIASLIGLAIGSGTLVAAWLAARWAKKAADHTERGANAADEAVKETRRIGEAQTRAYIGVYINGMTWNPSQGITQMSGRVINTGMTPALTFDIKVVGRLIHKGELLYESKFEFLEDREFFEVQGQGREIINMKAATFPEDVGQLVMAGEVSGEISLEYKFTDVFGVWTTRNLEYVANAYIENTDQVWVQFPMRTGKRQDIANDDSRDHGQ